MASNSILFVGSGEEGQVTQGTMCACLDAEKAPIVSVRATISFVAQQSESVVHSLTYPSQCNPVTGIAEWVLPEKQETKAKRRSLTSLAQNKPRQASASVHASELRHPSLGGEIKDEGEVVEQDVVVAEGSGGHAFQFLIPFRLLQSPNECKLHLCLAYHCSCSDNPVGKKRGGSAKSIKKKSKLSSKNSMKLVRRRKQVITARSTPLSVGVSAFPVCKGHAYGNTTRAYKIMFTSASLGPMHRLQ